MICQHIFQKGKLKGTLCNKVGCKKHKIKTEKLIMDKLSSQDDIKKQILELNTTIENKSVIMKNFLSIQRLDSTSTEYYKAQSYIDQSIMIPWNTFYDLRKHIGLDISNDTLTYHVQNKLLIKKFIESIKSEFDKHIYGLENVKNEILNYICKFITNPYSQRNNIALYGPAGVCKTKFITVLSSVLNIPLRIISLGGMKDSSYLLGHSKTYQDSKCGIITQSIIDSQILNPIIYFDELDKVSSSEHGQDIYAVLSNITDPVINKTFKDRYFSNLVIDLSKVFYVFTFNDISKVDKVLLDRLNVINVNTPTKREKLTILRDYCLIDIVKNIGFQCDINLEDRCYNKIIDYTDLLIDNTVTSGIRESTRVLEKILLEINKEILFETFKITDKFIYIDYNTFIKYFDKLQHQFFQTTKYTSYQNQMYI